MPKTIKGARLIHKRSNDPGVSPTIPPNDDHTTGWLNTDIYIGELFINTSITESEIWFRESSGVTRISTLDDDGRLPKEQLTSNEQNIVDNFSMSNTIITPVITDTQYINVSCITSSLSINGISDVILDNLETTSTNIYYLSLYMDGETGSNLTINIKSTSEGTIITSSISGATTSKTGVCLMWTGAMWVIVSNTIN